MERNVLRSMARVPHVPVAIIGNGLGAFTTALSLHRAGVSNNIFIPDSKLTQLARQAVFIGGSAVRILDRLGLGSDYRVFGSPVHHVEIRDKRDREVISFKLDGLGAEVWTVPKDYLLQLFLEAIPPETVRFDCKLRTLRVDKAGSELQILHSQDHSGPISPPLSKLYSADFVIGADGGSSSFSTLLSRTVMTMPSGVTVWRAIVRHMNVDDVPLHRAREIWDRDRRFGYVRISHDEVMWWAIVTSSNRVVILRPFVPYLKRKFSDFPGLVHKLMCSVEFDRQVDRQEMKRVWPLHSPWIDRFSHRVALVGDARRPGSPEAFHLGNSFAVDDGYILANVIVDRNTRGGEGDNDPLNVYNENRERNLQNSRRLSKQVQRLANTNSLLQRYVVKALLRQAINRITNESMSTVLVASSQNPLGHL